MFYFYLVLYCYNVVISEVNIVNRGFEVVSNLPFCDRFFVFNLYGLTIFKCKNKFRMTLLNFVMAFLNSSKFNAIFIVSL